MILLNQSMIGLLRMDENKCEIAGCNSVMFQRLNGVQLCAKHHSQMKSHGKILGRTIWCVMICVRKKHINLGYFEKFEDAVNARVNAEKKYFKEYRASNELEVNNI